MYAELKQKKCSRCNEIKEEKEFYKVAGGSRPRSECKNCTNFYHAGYRRTAKGREASVRARKKYNSSPDNVLKDRQNKQEWARFKKYGITKTQFMSMLQAQNGKCQTCDALHENEPNGLVVDHCHTTGEVRGLLCSTCNSALGFFKDNIAAIQKAADYLKKFKK